MFNTDAPTTFGSVEYETPQGGSRQLTGEIATGMFPGTNHGMVVVVTDEMVEAISADRVIRIFEQLDG